MKLQKRGNIWSRFYFKQHHSLLKVRKIYDWNKNKLDELLRTQTTNNVQVVYKHSYLDQLVGNPTRGKYSQDT